MVAALGVVVVVAAGVLLAAPRAGRPDGSPAPSSPGPVTTDALLAPAEGEVIYFASDADGDYDLYALEPGRGRPRRLTATTRWERQPAVAPDGETIAYVVGMSPVVTSGSMSADGTGQEALVTHAADDTDPTWSADGRSLAFTSRRSDPSFDVFEIRDRGDGLDQRNARNLTGRPAAEQVPDWAPAGRRMVISSNHFGQNRDLVIIDAADRDVQRRLTSTFAFDPQPRIRSRRRIDRVRPSDLSATPARPTAAPPTSSRSARTADGSGV